MARGWNAASSRGAGDLMEACSAFWKHRRETEKNGGEDEVWVPAEEQEEVPAEGEKKNVTNDANLEMAKSEVAVKEGVVETQEKPGSSIDEFLGLRGEVKDRLKTSEGGAKTGLGAIEAEIFARGPLLRPVC